MPEQIKVFEEVFGRLGVDTYYGVTLKTTAGETSAQAKYVARGGGWLKTTRSRIVHLSPILGSRSWREIERDKRDEFMLVAPRTTELVLRQFGRMTRIGADSMVLIATGAPYEFERLRAGEITSHHLPGSVVRDAVSNPEQLCAIPFASNHGVGDAIRSLCASGWREMDHLNDAERYLIVSNIITLVGAACRGNSKGVRTTQPKISNLPPFTRAIDYIERSIDDPGLCPGRIADAVGVSVSRLHALMKRHDTTTGKLIMKARLVRCANELRADEWRDGRISDIAFRWGFNDAAHFSRCFRKRFGCSPTEYRG